MSGVWPAVAVCELWRRGDSKRRRADEGEPGRGRRLEAAPFGSPFLLLALTGSGSGLARRPHLPRASTCRPTRQAFVLTLPLPPRISRRGRSVHGGSSHQRTQHASLFLFVGARFGCHTILSVLSLARSCPDTLYACTHARRLLHNLCPGFCAWASQWVLTLYR